MNRRASSRSTCGKPAISSIELVAGQGQRALAIPEHSRRRSPRGSRSTAARASRVRGTCARGCRRGTGRPRASAGGRNPRRTPRPPRPARRYSPTSARARELPHAQRAVRRRRLDAEQHAPPALERFVVGILFDVQHVSAEPWQRDAPHVDLHALLLVERHQRESSDRPAISSSEMSYMPDQSSASSSRSSAAPAGTSARHASRAPRRENQDCGWTSRMSPSCAVLATSTPARE